MDLKKDFLGIRLDRRRNRRWLVADINDCAAIQERLPSFKNGSHPVWKEPEPRAQTGAIGAPTAV